MPEQVKFLIAEYCASQFYMGWHLYVRDSKGRQQRNTDGGWGWIRSIGRYPHCAEGVLRELGIVIRGDGTCDDDGIAEIARRFPIPRQRIGGKPRGCIEVLVNEEGQLRLPNREPIAAEVE